MATATQDIKTSNFAADPESIDRALALDDLKKSLRKQHRFEVNGAELKNPEKFMLDQKFGLVDPVLTREEKQLIAAEEARFGR